MLVQNGDLLMKRRRLVWVSPMMPMYKVHDVSIHLRRGFAANHDSKGFDEVGKDVPLTNQMLQVNRMPNLNSCDDFVGKLGDVMSSISLRNARRRRLSCFCVVVIHSSITLGLRREERFLTDASRLGA